MIDAYHALGRPSLEAVANRHCVPALQMTEDEMKAATIAAAIKDTGATGKRDEKGDGDAEGQARRQGCQDGFRQGVSGGEGGAVRVNPGGRRTRMPTLRPKLGLADRCTDRL
jgi:hypothetical protein